MPVAQARAAPAEGAGPARAQQGAASQSGGPLLLGGGDAGTPGAANTWAGSTLVQLGQLDAATQSSAALQLLAGAMGAFLSIVCTAGEAVLTVTTGLTLAVGAVNLALTPAGLALTVPLVQVANAPAPPATSPPSGVYLYVDTGAWKARSAAGVITTMAPTGTAGATVTLLDWIAGDCTTSTTQAQLLLTYIVPANALVELDAVIQARNPANGNGSWFRRVVRVKRSPGSPGNAVLKSTTTPVPDDDENGCVISVEVKLFSVYLLVTGPVGLVCFGSARVQVLAP